MILFHVYKRTRANTLNLDEPDDQHMFVMAEGREEAKRAAQPILFHNPDNYVVEPLTKPGDLIHFSLRAVS